jgi:hypothetical protein
MAVGHVVDERRIYRTPLQARAFWVLTAFAVAVGAAQFGRPGQAYMGVYLLLGAVMMARCALTALVVNDDGLTVRNPFKTQRVEWSAVTAFEIGRYKLLGDVLLIRRGEQRPVHVFAVEGITAEPTRKSSIEARAIAAELNERLAGGSDRNPKPAAS